MDIQLYTALIIGKIVKFLTRFLKIGGGTAAPGLASISLDKNFIQKTVKACKISSIVITGTNGKTTTSRMLNTILEKASIQTIHNRAGSNLLRGVASTLIEKANLAGTIQQQLAIWETDEAAMPEVIIQTKPKILIITNLFRDQLDRFGEIDKLRNIWGQAIKNFDEKETLVLNADDPQIAFLPNNPRAKIFYFGLNDESFGSKNLPKITDARFCPNCGKPLNYKTVYVYHMGDYFCPKCSLRRPKLKVFVKKILKLQPESAKFELSTPEGEIEIKLTVGGLYNIYNALAAATCAVSLGIDLTNIKSGLEGFRAAFGRVEKFIINDKKISLYLVKNPAGFNEVIKTLFGDTTKWDVLIAINDKIADGKDVSWLWDVDFENLSGKTRKVFVTGIRAQDMALRLKYAQIKEMDNFVDDNIEKALKTAINSASSQLLILPTYTAMLEIRKILNKAGHGAKFWED